MRVMPAGRIHRCDICDLLAKLDAERRRADEAEYRVLHDAVSGGCDHYGITDGVCDDCHRHVMAVKLPGGRITFVLDAAAAERELAISRKLHAAKCDAHMDELTKRMAAERALAEHDRAGATGDEGCT